MWIMSVRDNGGQTKQKYTTHLDTIKSCNKAPVKIVAREGNVGSELQPPKGHFFGQGSPQHGIDRVVANLCDDLW